MSTYYIAAQLYNPWNELMVPAGIMQFPVFDKKLPMYMNFGSMGSILAHELINAIDNIGKQTLDIGANIITVDNHVILTKAAGLMG
jgi:endothelin-converting enzyme